MTEKRKAEALFALLFASLAILHLVYFIHYEQTKLTNFKVVGLFAVDKETKYVGYYIIVIDNKIICM